MKHLVKRLEDFPEAETNVVSAIFDWNYILGLNVTFFLTVGFLNRVVVPVIPNLNTASWILQ